MANKNLKKFNVPKLTDEQVSQLQSDNEELREMSLLAILNETLPNIPKEHIFKMRERRTVELVHHATFELIGGVPRMTKWADENPTEFFKLYSRLLPQEKQAQANTQIIINSNVGKSPLDNVQINGEVVDAEVHLDKAAPNDEDEY